MIHRLHRFIRVNPCQSVFVFSVQRVDPTRLTHQLDNLLRPNSHPANPIPRRPDDHLMLWDYRCYQTNITDFCLCTYWKIRNNPLICIPRIGGTSSIENISSNLNDILHSKFFALLMYHSSYNRVWGYAYRSSGRIDK